MAKFYDTLSPELQEFIHNQKIFFTGTAAAEGRINVSPKGMDSLKVLGPDKLIWLNLTGSGNETAAHIRQVNRLTLMWCAFEGKPLILRVYGSARAIHPGKEQWEEYLDHFTETAGARQVFEVQIESVQTSCGFAVPYMDYKEDRPILKDWAEKAGKEGVKEYWGKKNVTSIDGLETGIFDQ